MRKINKKNNRKELALTSFLDMSHVTRKICISKKVKVRKTIKASKK